MRGNPEQMYQEMRIFAQHQGAIFQRKRTSRFMHFLAKILFFNKRFMDSYTTTIGNTIYLSEKAMDGLHVVSDTSLLAHELTHVSDYQKSPLLYSVKYLFPQILAALSLLAFLGFVSLWFLFFLLFLLALLPWPAYWRMQYELRGYTISEAVLYWYGIRSKPELSTRINSFLEWGYYRMWPFPENLKRRFAVMERKILNNELFPSFPWAPDFCLIVQRNR